MYTTEEIQDYTEHIRHLRMRWEYLFLKGPLIKLLEEVITGDPEKFGKIGTYDVIMLTISKQPHFQFMRLHNILNVLPLEEVPLHINDEDPYNAMTAHWRLKIGR